MRLIRSVVLVGAVVCGSSWTLSAQSPTSQTTVFEKPYWTEQPVIEALGRAEVEIFANRAGFWVEFQEMRKSKSDAKLAMQMAVDRGRIAYEVIKKIAGDDAFITTSVNVSPFYEQYRHKQGYLVANERPDKVKGYQAIARLTVELKTPEKAGQARAAALTLGPEDAGDLRIYLERTAEVNLQAYEAAVRDASARARLAAAASGARLGKLLLLQEGQGPCLGRWTSPAGSMPSKQQPVLMADYGSRVQETVNVTVTGSRRGARGQVEEIVITQEEIDSLTLPSDNRPQTVSAQVCLIYAVG